MAEPRNARHLGALRQALRAGKPSKLERLAADIVGRLIDVRLSIATSGFQHGGDAGTTGRSNRHLRLECKRYADNTPLSDRELQGEVDDALRRTPALEAWVLVATREVSENTQETLNLKARKEGVPIVIIDWAASSGTLPDLAALCGWAPDLVEVHYDKAAAESARALTAASAVVVGRMQQELQPWRIGYEQLRQAAAQRIQRIWNNEADSQSAFAQKAAGGATDQFLPRKAVLAAINAWWASADLPKTVVFGAEGVGKTWAAVHWVTRELDRLPITLTLPASAFLDVKAYTESGVMEFLASALVEVTGTQDEAFWRQRLRRLLTASDENDPVILLLIDGLNQEPSYPWLRIIQVLQGGIFRARIRLVMTTQSNYLEQRLDGLRGAGAVPRIGVEPYDLSSEGELDQMLARYGRTRASLAPDLVPLARVPRLFPLVMKLSANAALEGDATLIRLLYAYGRDEHGLREGRAFTESEWEAWLQQLADALWTEIQSGKSNPSASQPIGLDKLEGMVSRPTLEPSLNYRRLQEIIDGTWMEQVPSKPGTYRPKDSTIHLALGAAVLRLLEDALGKDSGAVDSVLQRWLDPIAATSAAADILAASLSIAVAKRLSADSAVVNAIVVALLGGQNTQDVHRQQVVSLAPAIVPSLLNAVERCGGRAFASARYWALTALRRIPTANSWAWSEIRERLVSWVAHVHCPRGTTGEHEEAVAGHQSQRLRTRIGVWHAGTHSVMGVPIRLHEGHEESLAEYVPALLLGQSLVAARRVLAAAAVAAAIDVNFQEWDGLKWLVSLNPIDAEATTAELATLAETALTVVPEAGVNSELPKRVAALLLWLSGSEPLERRAAMMRVSFEGGLSYEVDYLPHPTRSFFGLERRHLDLLWDDEGAALASRVRTVKRYLPDPAVRPSSNFLKLIETRISQFDVHKLDTMPSVTNEDNDLEDFTPAAARFSPAALAVFAARWYASLFTRSGELRHWAGLRAPQYLLLADAPAATAVRAMRLNRPEPAHEHEPHIVTRLLQVELLSLPIDEQLDTIVSTPDAYLTWELMGLLKQGDESVLTRFLERWSTSHQRAMKVAFNYLALKKVSLSFEMFANLAPIARESDPTLRILAFIGLQQSNSAQFGHFLVRHNWRAANSQTTFEQDHGSQAILAASPSTPLSDLKFIVAPWCLLAEARRRGGSAEDAKIAAHALSGALDVSGVDVEHPTVDVSVDLTRRPGTISFFPPVMPPNSDDSEFDEMLDFEVQRQRHAQAQASGNHYITQARDAGAVLALRVIDVADARMLVENCSAEIDVWLAGYEQRSLDFRRRLNLAGGLFQSLCEALLEVEWQRGVELWHAIDECLRMKFSGAAGINDLLHMPFRVNDNPGVLALRDHLYALTRNPNDKSYLDIVICAISNKQTGWLRRKAAEDNAAGIAWRGKRSILIEGLIEVADASRPTWSSGPTVGMWDWLRRRGDTWANDQAFARHWWRLFLEAETPATAFAAWNVFLICIDRRALTWLKADIAIHGRDDELGRAKLAHLDANWAKLEAAIRDKESKGNKEIDRHLFGWRSPEHWFEREQLALAGA